MILDELKTIENAKNALNNCIKTGCNCIYIEIGNEDQSLEAVDFVSNKKSFFSTNYHSDGTFTLLFVSESQRLFSWKIKFSFSKITINISKEKNNLVVFISEEYATDEEHFQDRYLRITAKP